MPTFRTTARFRREFQALTRDQRAAFLRAVQRFVEDLRRGEFRPGLRVKGVRSSPGIFEMTWAPNGGATFQFGGPIRSREPHVIWRRIGTHEVLGRP